MVTKTISQPVTLPLGTTSAVDSYVGEEGELVVDARTNKRALVVCDGSTPGGKRLGIGVGDMVGAVATPVIEFPTDNQLVYSSPVIFGGPFMGVTGEALVDIHGGSILQLARDSSFSNVVHEVTGGDSAPTKISLINSDISLADGRWYARLAYISETGSRSNWSAVRSFRVTATTIADSRTAAFNALDFVNNISMAPDGSFCLVTYQFDPHPDYASKGTGKVVLYPIKNGLVMSNEGIEVKASNHDEIMNFSSSVMFGHGGIVIAPDSKSFCVGVEHFYTTDSDRHGAVLFFEYDGETITETQQIHHSSLTTRVRDYGLLEMSPTAFSPDGTKLGINIRLTSYSDRFHGTTFFEYKNGQWVEDGSWLSDDSWSQGGQQLYYAGRQLGWLDNDTVVELSRDVLQVHKRQAGKWLSVATVSKPADTSYWGNISVSSDSSRIVAAANNNVTLVYTFNDNNTLTQTHSFSGIYHTRFNITGDGQTIFGGDYTDGTQGETRTGVIRVFKLINNTWTLSHELYNPAVVAHGYMGYTYDINQQGSLLAAFTRNNVIHFFR